MSDPGPTLTLSDAASHAWDAVVIGAGPAGGAAAYALARCGASVLLVEKSAFPRDKVCGCCINGAALAALERLDLDEIPGSLGAVRTEHLRLHAGDRQATLSIARGVVLSRAALDGEVVRGAITAGADFMPETSADIGDVERGARSARLRHRGREREILAKVVLAADGLAGTSLRRVAGMQMRVRRRSRMGAAAIVGGDSLVCEADAIHMACAPNGYVGFVRLEDGRTNIAAALDPAWVKRIGGPGAAAARILSIAGFPGGEKLRNARWRGTSLLTRRRRAVAAERLLVLGDAAGYIEPFTGEGIAWALAAAAEVIEPALSGIERWNPAIVRQWTARHRSLVRGRQLTCRVITRTLRSYALTRAVVGVLALRPRLAEPLVRTIQRPRARADIAFLSPGRDRS